GGGERTLRLSRSLELFRVPPPEVGLAEWILVAGLLLLALLAALAKRWQALDVHYKCLLGSLVLHVAVMLYLATVSPRGFTASGGGGALGPTTFRLTMKPRPSADGGSGGAAGRGGSGGARGSGALGEP